jgi:hypothetical protein
VRRPTSGTIEIELESGDRVLKAALMPASLHASSQL